MTRAYVDYVTKNEIEMLQATINAELGEENHLNIIEGMYSDSNSENPFFLSAARLMRYLSPLMHKTRETVHASLSKKLQEDTSGVLYINQGVFKKNFNPAYVQVEEDFSSWIVFPSLLYSGSSTAANDHSNVTWFQNSYVIEATMDLINEGPKEAWNTPSRGIDRLKRRKVYTTTRLLKRVMKLSTSDDEMRDIAREIENSLRPPVLLYADEPADFIDMYQGGPSSCMTGESRDWTFLIKDHKHHPTSFYAYHPHTRGVYIKKNGVPVARALLIESENGNWERGRIYSSDGATEATFCRLLGEAGIEPKRNTVNKDVMFDIPALANNRTGDYSCPFPYFDNLTRGSMYARFNEDEDTFTITNNPNPHHNKYTNINFVGQRGYFISSEVYPDKKASVQCNECGNYLNEFADDVSYLQYDGDNWCSSECLPYELIYAQRGDGDWEVMHRRDAYQTMNGEWFTSRRACIDHGGKPVLIHTSCGFLPPEDHDLCELSLSRRSHIVNGVSFTLGSYNYNINGRAKNPDYPELPPINTYLGPITTIKRVNRIVDFDTSTELQVNER